MCVVYLKDNDTLDVSSLVEMPCELANQVAASVMMAMVKCRGGSVDGILEVYHKGKITEDVSPHPPPLIIDGNKDS